MSILRILGIVLQGVGLAAASVGPGRMPFRLLGKDEGLTPGAVLCMAQDRDGFLWMGGENGLMRYEGGRSRPWGAEDGLPSASVSRLEVTPDGSVWAGTLRGLVRYKDGRFERARLDGEVSTRVIGDLAVDRTGRVWAYTFDGLARQRDGLEFERVTGIARGSVYDLACGPRSGLVYLATQDGIQVFRDGRRIAAWGPQDGLPPQGPVFCIEDGRGRLWAGSGRTLVLREPGAARFQDQSQRLSASLSPNGAPYLDQDGSVWLPTQAGAQHLDGEFLDAASGLPFRWVRTVFRDREGSLWVLGPGLAHLLGRGRVLSHLLTPGEGGEVVWNVLRAPDGRILAATDNGVVRLEASGPRRLPGTLGWRIKAMAYDREGTLWMVNTRGPTLWLRKGRARAEAAPLGDLGMGLNSVFCDRAGEVWLGGTLQGLLRWSPSLGRLRQEVGPAFTGARVLGVYEIHEDGQGRLWAGADGGILVREGAGWRLYADPAGLRVRGMALLADGTAWIHNEEPLGLRRVALAGTGLQVLERRTRGWGLPSNMVYAVRAGPQGQVWASTDLGLDRLDPPLHLGRHDGLVSEDCAISALRVEDGSVWVGTSGGLAQVLTGPGEAAPVPPQAFVTGFSLGPRRLDPPFAIDPLPYDQATLDIRVAAPTYLNEQDLRFQVRLVGLEEGWRDLEGRVVHLASLPGGAYRFEVRAAQAQGPFGPVASVAFRVDPPWWRTPAFRALEILAGILAVAGLFRLRLASLARSKAVLEGLVSTRTRELSQRNQDLSEALGNVKQLSGLLPICAHCKKIRDDKGYWNQLETYLSAHTGAGFSHGICPECASRVFPEFRKPGDCG